jgi:hypothetical protein
MSVVAGYPQDIVISCNYDATGLAWVDLFDNPPVSWIIDETSGQGRPVVAGSLPPPPPATAPVLSPTWAHLHTDSLYVPDMWRGGMMNFFTWLASNNGATRLVRGNFMSINLASAMETWRQQNPGMWNPQPFPP